MHLVAARTLHRSETVNRAMASIGADVNATDGATDAQAETAQTAERPEPFPYNAGC
jgi:hypothetical protein